MEGTTTNKITIVIRGMRSFGGGGVVELGYLVLCMPLKRRINIYM